MAGIATLTYMCDVPGSAPFYRFSPNHTEADLKRRYCKGPFSNPMPHMAERHWNFEVGGSGGKFNHIFARGGGERSCECAG